MIKTVHLFPILDSLLIQLLKDLSMDDWHRPTLSPNWRVKDIAAHLLDGNIRALSTHRDSYFGEKPDSQEDYQDLLNFLNRLNADWAQAMRRVSPNVLINLLDHTGRQYSELLQSLDPMAPTLFSVAWAGEAESLNWFHVAREYTEKWHHQQQIRQAVDKETPLYTPALYKPFLDTSMRALPHHYRAVSAKDGDRVLIKIQGEEEWTYQIMYKDSIWHLTDESIDNPIALVTVPGQIAWRIFCKELPFEQAIKDSTIKGDRALAEHFFRTVAIMG